MHNATVLLHGFLGFSQIGPIQYFRGVAHILNQAGIYCLSPQVPAAGTIKERAESLADQLFQSDIQNFSLFGHSMGGLDARYLISFLDPNHRIKQLITIGTPHHGSTVANWFLDSRRPFPSWIRYRGMPGLGELTPETRQANPIPDRADVIYRSYASARPVHELPFWLRPYARMIPAENDGLVSVESAKWGDFRGTLHADHFELIGWNLSFPNQAFSRPFDHLAFWSQFTQNELIT